MRRGGPSRWRNRRWVRDPRKPGLNGLPNRGGILPVSRSGVFREIRKLGYVPGSPCPPLPHAIKAVLQRAVQPVWGLPILGEYLYLFDSASLCFGGVATVPADPRPDDG